ncbi:MAG: glycosyltransferase family 9 protein [Acidobacteriota bacterium]|nr:MAG: glycosyltransferase family 9 protein [Acidobacteriota bacterium]
MRVLIVKLSSIGDIVHTLPAAAAIRRAVPDANIYWVAERRSSEVLRNNRLLDGLIEVDTKALRRGNAVLGKTLESAFRQFQELRAPELDLSIDFQGLFKSASIARLSGAGRRFGFTKDNLREPECRFLYTDRVEVEPVQNVVTKNLELAEKAVSAVLGERLSFDRTTVEFPITTDVSHREEAEKVAEQAGGLFAILNPGGGWVTKLWRAEDYGALADLIYEQTGLVPVVTAGPGENELIERVSSAARSARLIPARLSLKGFHELARLAAVYVGGDTGPTHLAVAAGCPVVGIFGPTEWWRNGSVNPEDVCVGREDIECRINCHRRTCNRWICMDISPAEVLEAVQARLRTAKRAAGEKAAI